MNSFQSTIRRAQRRVLLDRAIRLCGWGVASGLVLGLLILAVDRLLALQLQPRLFLYPVVAGVAAGIITALLTQPHQALTAIRIDRALRLKDRMGTAQILEQFGPSPVHDPEFAALVEQEAQRIASGVDLKYATPIRITGVWAAALVLGAGLWIANAFLPAANWPNAQNAEQSGAVQNTALQQQLAHQYSESIQQAAQELPRDQGDERTAEQLAALDRLAEQLRNPDSTPEELDAVREETAAKLDEVADRLAQNAERDQAAAEALAQRFQGMESPANPNAPMTLQQFTEALKKGEFGNAAQEIEKILNEPETLPAADRKVTADELRKLSEQIDRLAEREQTPSIDQRQRLEQALQDQGLDEQAIEELLNDPPSAEELERELQQNNIDPEIAREMARDVQKLQDQQRIEEQSKRDIDEVAESLKRAADELETPPQSPQPAASQPSGASTPPQTQPSPTQPTANREHEQTSEPPTSQPRSQSNSQEEPSEEGQQKNSTSRNEDRQQPGANDQPRQSDENSQPQQKPDQQGEGSQQQSQSENRQQQRDQQPAAGREPTSASQPAGAKQHSQQSAERNQQKQSQAPQTQPGKEDEQQRQQQQAEGADQPQQPDQPEAKGQQRQQQPNATEQEQSSADEQRPQSKSPAQVLRELAERRDGQASKQQAERLRQLAREMSDNMTPQQREQWAKQWQRQNGSPDQQGDSGNGEQPKNSSQRMAGGARADSGQVAPEQSPRAKGLTQSQTEDVDLRGDEPANQLMTQWLTGEKTDPSQPSASTSDSAERVRQVQDVAERAVNDSVVQKRYHKMIKRYFNRLPETIERANSPQPPASANPPATTSKP